MEIKHIIIFLGILIFSAHVFNALFKVTKIPSVLLLLLIGILVGPVMGYVDESFFGEMGSIFTTLTLIIILFESGTSLRISDIRKSLGSASVITIVNFVVTMIVATIISIPLLGLSWLNALFFASIIGGTSSAVVIPMVKQLKLGTKSETVLMLESAFSDVLCLVVGLAILDGLKVGAIDLTGMLTGMGLSFLLATIAGLLSGVFWSVILSLLRNVKNSMFTSLAFLFIVYGVVELYDLNGGIAALSFGIMLGNSNLLLNTKWFKKNLNISSIQVQDNEKSFFSEIVFVLQTYFFVYIGICIQFSSPWLYIVALIVFGSILFLRPFSIRILSSKGVGLRDAAIMSVMTPKGLIAAVMASLPLQMGLAQGQEIKDLGFAIVLLSIVICSLLIIILNKNPRIITPIFRLQKFDKKEDVINQPPSAPESLEKEIDGDSPNYNKENTETNEK
jgi:potassium/hydrogen antiporter